MIRYKIGQEHKDTLLIDLSNINTITKQEVTVEKMIDSKDRKQLT